MVQFLPQHKKYYTPITSPFSRKFAPFSGIYWNSSLLGLESGRKTGIVAKLRQANIPSGMQSKIGGIRQKKYLPN